MQIVAQVTLNDGFAVQGRLMGLQILLDSVFGIWYGYVNYLKL